MKTAPDVDGRIQHAFRRVMTRKPMESDMRFLRRAYERQAEIYRKNPEAAKAFVSVGSAKRDDKLNVSEHAALTAVCLAILNLDEALTRE